MSKITFNPDFKYQRVYGKISGYTTSYNSLTMGYPFVESIKSMLGFCDEVVVVDHSTDGTYEVLEQLQKEDDRLQLYQNEWTSDPGMDGNAKAFSRALCQHDFLWQQDLDEFVHEDDYEKIKMITKRFPNQAPVLALPMVELWGNPEHATLRRHTWKWRMSKNLPEITHGINKNARLVDEQTGEVYAKEGMSDGCEYVNVISYDYIPHVGFYSQQLEMLRQSAPGQFGQVMNQVYGQLPSVWHTSWMSLPLKIKQFTANWDKQWSNLYKTANKPRFPGVGEDSVDLVSQKLYDQGGEDSDQIKGKFKLDKQAPKLLLEWVEKNGVKLNH